MNQSSLTISGSSVPSLYKGAMSWLSSRLEEVNRELWLVLSMFVLAAVLNFAAGTQRMILGFYSLPTLFSAYVYGRRHAVLTATASGWLVGLMVYFNPQLLAQSGGGLIVDDKWFDLAVWAGILLLTAYAMGTLYERREHSIRELREAYQGILLMLQALISKDKDAEDHSYRVSIYAARIAQGLKLEADRVEDVRSAALLHELVNLEVGHAVLLKAARHTHAAGNIDIQSGRRVGGSLTRVLPILMAAGHTTHPCLAGSNGLPLEARILSVADVYDSLTSDRPYRKAMSPFDAKEVIVRGSGSDFDPSVVKTFVAAFDRRQLEPSAYALTGTDNLGPSL